MVKEMPYADCFGFTEEEAPAAKGIPEKRIRKCGFEKAALKEMLSFALNGVDAVNIGSKNVRHIQEILESI